MSLRAGSARLERLGATSDPVTPGRRSWLGHAVVAACLAITGLAVIPAIVGSNDVAAAEAVRRVVELRQPDGTKINVLPFGNEWYHGYETLDGYTLVQNDLTGFWEYARPRSDGELEAGGARPGHGRPDGLAKHLRDQGELDFAEATSITTAPLNNKGTQRSLVILAQFTDRTSLGTTAAQWSSRFFGATNSLRDYYLENSYDQLAINAATESHGTSNDGIVGWVTLNRTHPRAVDLRDTTTVVHATIRDAIIAANPYVNYASYDTNGDGWIQTTELHITVIMAGGEGAMAKCQTTYPSVWAHQHALYDAEVPVLDTKSVGAYGYTTFGEMHCEATSNHQATLGIIAHEMGHDLGLPDMYDYDDSSDGGVGDWSLMGSGSWLPDDGTKPAHLDAWSKVAEGWVTPSVATSATTGTQMAQVETNKRIVQFRTNSGGVNWNDTGTGTGEFFLMENRQKVGYDAALPGCGILIWHIDESRASNENDARRIVDLEEADNNNVAGQAADPWKGSRTFNDASSPNSKLYDGLPSGVTISNFSASCAATMTLNIGGNSVPGVPNDAFATAAGVTSLPYAKTGLSTAAATTETGEPAIPAACGAIGKTVWFRYTPQVSASLVASTVGSNFDTVLSVWRGTSIGSLVNVGCNDDLSGTDQDSRFAFAATGGQTYYFQVGGYKGTSVASGLLTFNLRANIVAPSHDAFGSAKTVGALPYTDPAINNLGATVQSGEPAVAASCGAIGKTVWYRYVAGSNTTLVADTLGAQFDTVMGVYRGTTLGGLVTVGCDDDIDAASGNRASRVEFAVTSGQTYYVQVGGYSGTDGVATGIFPFHLGVATNSTANDAFGSATSITTLPYARTTLDTTAATVQTGEPAPACAQIGKTVWFKYTATSSRTLVADTVGSEFDTVLAVWRGTAIGSLTAVGCNDDVDNAGGDTRSRVSFAVTSGQTYYLQVGGFRNASGSASGNLAFRLAAASTAPSNDNFVSAHTATPLPFTRVLSTASATNQAGEPAPSCGQIGKTVWYKVTPSASTTLVADTVGSNFDTVVSVWRGTAISALTAVGCNDDINNAGGNYQSRVSFGVTAGQTYYIQVGGFRDAAATASGNLTFNLVSAGGAPGHNAFASALAIGAFPYSHATNTTNATIQTGEPAPACAPIGKTVWYKVTIGTSGLLTASTTGSTFDTVLAVWRGTSIGALTAVGCNDDIDNAAGNVRSRVQFTAQAGQTYYFQVGGYNGAGGALQFNVTAP